MFSMNKLVSVTYSLLCFTITIRPEFSKEFISHFFRGHIVLARVLSLCQQTGRKDREKSRQFIESSYRYYSLR